MLKERIYSVLVLSSQEKFNDSIAEFLPQACFSPVEYAKSVNAAQRKTVERSYDIVIINAPLPDDYGAKFAIDLSSNQTSAVLLLAKEETYDAVREKVSAFGVFTLKKPLSSAMILQALEWLKTTRERLRSLEKKTVTLQEKMEEIKLINRAKWALIHSCGMTEADAHRYIEKQAMDRCVTRREIAQTIIQTYD